MATDTAPQGRYVRTLFTRCRIQTFGNTPTSPTLGETGQEQVGGRIQKTARLPCNEVVPAAPITGR